MSEHFKALVHGEKRCLIGPRDPGGLLGHGHGGPYIIIFISHVGYNIYINIKIILIIIILIITYTIYKC
jgi:hypothetical protein